MCACDRATCPRCERDDYVRDYRPRFEVDPVFEFVDAYPALRPYLDRIYPQ